VPAVPPVWLSFDSYFYRWLFPLLRSLCLRGISFAAVSPVPPFGLRRCASTRAQELPSRLCAVHEVEASLLVCGAFCSVEVTRLRETKVSMIFVIGLFDLYMDLCRRRSGIILESSVQKIRDFLV
jgi:hypothetical protein